jgi:hypothetical protein
MEQARKRIRQEHLRRRNVNYIGGLIEGPPKAGKD